MDRSTTKMDYARDDLAKVRKNQKVRQFILGFKEKILILAKIKLPFRILRAPPAFWGKKTEILEISFREMTISQSSA